MSNFLLKKPDCVFIHIPKTAGTSIRKGVWKGNYEGPVFGTIPEEWAKLFSFAFVRHPLQRFISAYKMFTMGTRAEKNSGLQIHRPRDSRPLSIEEFLDIVTDESIIFDERRSTLEERIRHHTIPQTHPFNCLHLADFIGRHENINVDIQIVSLQVGIQIDLPHMHTTNDIHWKNFLKGETLNRCRQFYEEDLETLQYKLY
jgi:hypothetical protein